MKTGENLAAEWNNRALVALTSHYDAARHYNSLNYWLGIPALILTTIVGTTVFANLSKDVSENAKLLTGLLAIAAAILSALQTFLKHSERAERCKVMAARYSSIGKELEVALTEPIAINKDFLDQIRIKLDQADADAPSIPSSIRDAARKKYRISQNPLSNK
jgi:Na+/melibiose symporter-like transporter